MKSEVVRPDEDITFLDEYVVPELPPRRRMYLRRGTAAQLRRGVMENKSRRSPVVFDTELWPVPTFHCKPSGRD